MYCLKCGKDTQAEQVFCAHCLEMMEQYPVKPGTPVQLPNRTAPAVPKKNRRVLRPEEQVEQLRKTVLRLRLALLVLLLLLGMMATAFFLRKSPSDTTPTENPIGQNYSIDITTD